MKLNGHPDPATLALHAGGDLGWFQAWRTERHVASCGECADEIAAYRALSASLPELTNPPDLPWNRIASEMSANIRLGLAAGECVREGAGPARRFPLFVSARAAVALAGVVALLVTGLVLERPTPSIMSAAVPVVQPIREGVERRSGDQSFALMHSGVTVKDVTYSVGAQGTIGASYVDPTTNLVTMTKVYVE
jgi:hypothetical protein